MSFKLRFGMDLNSLVSGVSNAYDNYIKSLSVDDGLTLYDQTINFFRYISTRGDQSVKLLNSMFNDYPVLEKACVILANNTPTCQDKSTPTPS